MATASPTTFRLRYHESRVAGRLAILTIDNGEDHRRPTVFAESTLVSLHERLDEIEAAGDIRGLLLTGKPFIFAAGADLRAFEAADDSFARRAAAAGHRAFGRLRELGFPTLAAINGVCLGGGLEIALHCDRRTLSSAAPAIGFPEVFLSIVPAWGGTQLAPRLMGAANAVQVIVANALANNRTLRPAQALELGLVDEVIPAVDFLDASVAHLEELVVEGVPPRAEPDHGDVHALMAGARAAVDGVVHGAAPAPYLALDLVGFAARGGTLAEGLAREEDALATLLPARHAQAAIYAFDLVQRRVRRQPTRPDVPPRPLRKVGVVGAGLMGAQLAALMLTKLEVPLVLKDLDPDVLLTARAEVEAAVDRRVERGRLDEGKARFLKGLVTYSTSDDDFAGADLLLEAVVERLDVKRAVFAALEEVVDDGCLLATNTSSLSVAAMAEGLHHPERVVGIHFFNPVSVLPLVEIVRGERTDDTTLATAFEFARGLGKSAVGCADAPAFVVNRILTRFLLACVDAVRRGDDVAAVDDAIKELGLPMGPFELIGLVGPAVAAHVALTLHEAFGERFPVDEGLAALGASGLRGVYDDDGKVHDTVRDLWRPGAGAEPLGPDGIREHALRATADEIARLLDDDVVADARDVDTCMLLGAGWPFFLGGICKYLDQTGLSREVVGRQLIDDPTGAA